MKNKEKRHFVLLYFKECSLLAWGIFIEVPSTFQNCTHPSYVTEITNKNFMDTENKQKSICRRLTRVREHVSKVSQTFSSRHTDGSFLKGIIKPRQYLLLTFLNCKPPKYTDVFAFISDSKYFGYFCLFSVEKILYNWSLHVHTSFWSFLTPFCFLECISKFTTNKKWRILKTN